MHILYIHIRCLIRSPKLNTHSSEEQEQKVRIKNHDKFNMVNVCTCIYIAN